MFSNSTIFSQVAPNFIQGFTAEQVSDVSVPSDSNTIWAISPSQGIQLINRLRNNTANKIYFNWKITRSGQQNLMNVEGSSSKDLKEFPEIRKKLAGILEHSGLFGKVKPGSSSKAVSPAIPIDFNFLSVPDLLPNYIYSQAYIADASVPTLQINTSDLYRPLHFGLLNSGSYYWWRIVPTGKTISNTEPFHLVVFSDNVASNEFLAFFSSYGIIGLYVTFVLLAARLFRLLFFDLVPAIIIRELPNVDRVWTLIRDIHLVRELKAYELEEDMFAKLLYLFRSPQTMINWTRLKGFKVKTK